jgi:hypothetical protein
MLVGDGKAMQFAGVREEEIPAEERDEDDWDDEEGSLEPIVRMVQPEVDIRDDKLNTRVREDRLHVRLLHMFTYARTAMEEQGVNVLFLALGMLHWYESESSEEERVAPLVLVPATLERYRGTRFRVRFSGEELGANLSLQAKLEQDFGLKLPDLPDDEELDVESYLRDVARGSVATADVSSARFWVTGLSRSSPISIPTISSISIDLLSPSTKCWTLTRPRRWS